MLGLILTLFISLFSSCPIVNTLDQQENKVIASSSIVSRSSVHNEGALTYLFTNADLMSESFIMNLYYRNPSWFDSHSSTPIYYYGLAAAKVWFSQLNFENLYDTPVVSDISWFSVSYDSSENVGQQLSTGGYAKAYKYFIDFRNSSGVTQFSYYFRIFEDRGLSGNNIVYQLEGDLIDLFENDHIAILEYTWTNSTLYDLVYDDGYKSAYENGRREGYDNGYTDGISNGYQEGFNAAIDELSETSSTALTIFTGILDVGLLPVNVFLQILNFNVFGINISGLVSGFLTIAIFMIVIRMIFGGKKND